VGHNVVSQQLIIAYTCNGERWSLRDLKTLWFV